MIEETRTYIKSKGAFIAAAPIGKSSRAIAPQKGANQERELLSLLDVLGDKWTFLIVAKLAAGPARFGELARQGDGMSHKTLSRVLKTLADCSLLSRHQFPTIPPKVIYTLTPKGETLVDPLRGLLDWARRNTSD